MNPEEVRQGAMKFINSKNTMVLATVSPDGAPQAAAIHFLIDDGFNLYFATGKESRKYKNLQKHNRVSFVIGAGPEVVTVQGGGVAEELNPEDLNLIGAIGGEIYEKANNDWPVLRLGHSGIAYFKIKPEWMVWLSLDKENLPESYYPDYHRVI